MSNHTKVTEALDQLGEMEPDEIAKFLLERGHKGARGASMLCPLALYLTSINGKVAVLSATVCAGGEEPMLAPLPISVREFVRGFDDGRYPQLMWRSR